MHRTADKLRPYNMNILLSNITKKHQQNKYFASLSLIHINPNIYTGTEMYKVNMFSGNSWCLSNSSSFLALFKYFESHDVNLPFMEEY